jgi:hypothetical protein
MVGGQDVPLIDVESALITQPAERYLTHRSLRRSGSIQYLPELIQLIWFHPRKWVLLICLLHVPHGHLTILGTACTPYAFPQFSPGLW